MVDVAPPAYLLSGWQKQIWPTLHPQNAFIPNLTGHPPVSSLQLSTRSIVQLPGLAWALFVLALAGWAGGYSVVATCLCQASQARSGESQKKGSWSPLVSKLKLGNLDANNVEYFVKMELKNVI